MTSCPFENLVIKQSNGRPLPAGLIQLRRDVFQDEVKYLNEATLESQYDDVGTHIMILEKDSGRVVAAAHVTRADQGEIASSGVLNEEQKRCGFNITRVMVDRAYRTHGLMRIAIYLALQQARLWGRTQLFCFVEAGETAAQKATRYELLSTVPHVVTGAKGSRHEFHIGTRDIARMAAYVYDGLPPAARKFLEPAIADEIAWTIEARLDQFLYNPWFKAIRNRTLSKMQYVESLANMYQFVRLTTRILGRAISLADDAELRAHFAEHLSGEIDHEKMIENDLKHLGQDVTYVRERMIPNKETRRFMVIQESLLGFRQDPILFLAVPFCIEGFSANLTQTFLTDLAQCLTNWGATPKAMSFIRSHVLTDGGDDGHWLKNHAIIRHCVRDDATVQEFLSLLHLTFDAIEDSYASFVTNPNDASAARRLNFEVAAEQPAYERALRLINPMTSADTAPLVDRS